MSIISFSRHLAAVLFFLGLIVQSVVAHNTGYLERTYAQVVAAVSHDSVQNAQYKITDIGDDGAYFAGTAPNIIDPTGTVYLFVPDHTITSRNKAQLYAGAKVAAGERWIWGNRIWESITGKNSEPVDELTLNPADWKLLTPSVENGYLRQHFIAELDIATGVIISLKQPEYQNEASLIILEKSKGAYPLHQWYNQTRNGVTISNVGYFMNNRLFNKALIRGNKEHSFTGIGFTRNIFSGGELLENELNNSSFTNNVLEGKFAYNILKTSTIANNKFLGKVSLTGNDLLNSHVLNCEIKDESAFTDNILRSNSRIEGATISGVGQFYANSLTNAAVLRTKMSGSSLFILNNLSFSVMDGNTLADSAYIISNMISNGQCSFNKLSNAGHIFSNVIRSTCQINNNTISGRLSRSSLKTFPRIGFCELNDNSQVSNNILSGDGACIWDVHAVENCSVNYNVLSGHQVSDQYAVNITDIEQLNYDRIDSNVLSGNGANIAMIVQRGYSSITNCVLAAENSSINNVELSQDGDITLFKFVTRGGISNVTVEDGTIANGRDIFIRDSEFIGVDIDFAGWTRDVAGVIISDGTGYMVFEMDFNAKPLKAGQPEYFGFIPNGAILTNCVIIPHKIMGGNNATLEIGLEGDDPQYGMPTTDLNNILGPITVNRVSNRTTGHRSMVLKAENGDVVTGSVQVMVEFIFTSNPVRRIKFE